MKYVLFAAATLAVSSLALIACNSSGLDSAPRATFSQIACLDINGDDRVNAADAADASELPDFNADDERDGDDAAYLQGVDIAIDPAYQPACDGEGDGEKMHEYLVAHGFFSDSDVSCDEGDEAVLLLGVGGGVDDLKDKSEAAGVRNIIDALQDSYDDRDVQTIGVIAGQAVTGAVDPNPAMEQWVANVVRVYSQRFPCLRTVLVGHSHGGVLVEAVASRIEGELGDRMIAVAVVDRVEAHYAGDIASRPQQVPVFHIFETNDAGFITGPPGTTPNFENWDASAEVAPESGDEGGDDMPVNHTTIDNSESVRQRIVDEVMERS
jgi:hypothetical protein